MGQIVTFPCETFFLEKVNVDNPADCAIIKLEAKVRNRALEEGDRIADEYKWESYMIYDSKHKLVMRYVDQTQRPS